MLSAEYRAIPFTGRGEDIEELIRWLYEDTPVSFRAVIGQGGSGKTRLGFELLEQLEKREPGVWHAGFLDRDHIEELNNARFQKWRKRRYTLVVLDYAAFFSEK